MALVDKEVQFLGKYDDMVPAPKPEDDPWVATEPVSEGEQAFYDSMFADFMEELYGPQRKNVIEMIRTTPEPFQGVAQAAFILLKNTYDNMIDTEGEIPQAALFGEGGMIHTAVDEVFKLGNVEGIVGLDDQNQYTAAQMDMARRVGEYLENAQEDDAVSEAQSLLMDVEQAYNPGVVPERVTREDDMDIAAIQFQDDVGEEPPPEEGGEEMVPEEGMVPEEEMMMEEAPMPPSGGLI